ncbi:MAG: hypothetical protein K2Z25_03515 [Beijerinckiaceae bacterium]|nr:hypothetical protein [Beijerinckiaceae bacterium]
MRLPLIAASLAAACALALPAAAQTNPLQQRPAAPARTAPATTASPAAEAAKPKRARSEAQLKNDNRLRACGAEWRANKPDLTKKGYNWIKYSTECRKRLAAQGQ